MARCGCSGSDCGCIIKPGPGVQVDGQGTAEKPYVISSDDSLAAIKTVSAPYTMALTDRVLKVLGTTLVKLPKVDTCRGHIFTVINIGTHTVTVGGNGANISGAPTKTLTTQWSRLTVVSDGSQFLLMS